MKNKQGIIIPLLLLILVVSCSLSKETLTQYNNTEREIDSFPYDYCLSLPALDTADWNKNYIDYDKFLSKEILRTQAGLSTFRDSIRIYTCFPSATPYVQLDSLTMIDNKNKIIGNWKIICNRRITFEDSVAYNDFKIHRKIKQIYNDKETEMCLSITETKYKLYAGTKNNSNLTLKVSRNYCLVNGRYLMLYNISKAGAAINFIGLDPKGHLIIDGFIQQERMLKGKYHVFHATMIQFIFQRVA